ncbi:MAG: FAD-dependent oxidoreductase [Oscillospiraceae bacterium]
MKKAETIRPRGILCEAEAFENYGGWTLDSQFQVEMGSAYLIAHGIGRKVADAVTTVHIPEDGSYKIWVRSKDWVPEYHPGRFTLLVDGKQVGGELGANGRGWCWDKIGELPLSSGEHTLTLHDLTGFDGRLDAVFFTLSDEIPPEEGKQVDRSWRKSLLGLPEEPVDAGMFDVIVVGGGLAGCAAAWAAGKSGSRVALLTDRPVLGGNASTEIGLGARGYMSDIVTKMSERQKDGSLGIVNMLREQPNVTVFHNEYVYSVNMSGDKIESVDARNTKTSVESRFSAPVFIDTSGKAAIAEPAGAEIRTGREGRDEFSESLAPEKGDKLHHGHTILYHLHNADHPVDFPDVPWATAVSRDFDSLNGQMGGLGKDNYFGPSTRGDRKIQQTAKALVSYPGFLAATKIRKHGSYYDPVKIMDFFPATHYWEYGQNMNLKDNEEEIRDHLLRALYGTFSNIKKARPKEYAGLEFEWLRIVPASGEYCRIMGDHIVNENEVREHADFHDAICQNDSAICIHCMENPEYDFRLTSWIWDVRDEKPYWIPFRSLYSKNISNLMMAGKQISVTRVVGCNTKLMGNGANHGIAVGCAAALCSKYNTVPRTVGQEYFGELKKLVEAYSD